MHECEAEDAGAGFPGDVHDAVIGPGGGEEELHEDQRHSLVGRRKRIEQARERHRQEHHQGRDTRQRAPLDAQPGSHGRSGLADDEEQR